MRTSTIWSHLLYSVVVRVRSKNSRRQKLLFIRCMIYGVSFTAQFPGFSNPQFSFGINLKHVETELIWMHV